MKLFNITFENRFCSVDQRNIKIYNNDVNKMKRTNKMLTMFAICQRKRNIINKIGIKNTIYTKSSFTTYSKK